MIPLLKGLWHKKDALETPQRSELGVGVLGDASSQVAVAGPSIEMTEPPSHVPPPLADHAALRERFGAYASEMDIETLRLDHEVLPGVLTDW